MKKTPNNPPWWPEIEKRRVHGSLTPPPRQTPIYIHICICIYVYIYIYIYVCIFIYMGV